MPMNKFCGPIWGLILFFTCSWQVSAQETLEQGAIFYKVGRERSNAFEQTEELHFYFGQDMIVQHVFPRQGEEGLLYLFDLKKGQMTNITIIDKDTIAQSYPIALSDWVAMGNSFKIKEQKQNKRVIAGYDGVHFEANLPKESSQFMEISGWGSHKIKSRIFPIPFPSLTREEPFMPLELDIKDLQTDSVLSLRAYDIHPINDAFFTALQEQIQQMAARSEKREAKKQAELQQKTLNIRAFQQDTSIVLDLKADSAWQVGRLGEHHFSLYNKALPAKCQISMVAKTGKDHPADMLDQLLKENEGYLVTLVRPSPAIEPWMFRGEQGRQQIWQFHNSAMKESRIFPEEYNPFSIFPMEELTINHRAFLFHGIQFYLAVQTTKANYETTMRQVETILNSMEIKGL